MAQRFDPLQAKGILFKWCADGKQDVPVFEYASENGQFVVRVSLVNTVVDGKRLLGCGRATKKKDAERNAIMELLQQLMDSGVFRREGKPTSEELRDLKTVMEEWEEAVNRAGGLIPLLEEHDAFDSDDEESKAPRDSEGLEHDTDMASPSRRSPTPEVAGIRVEDATHSGSTARPSPASSSSAASSSQLRWGGEGDGSSQFLNAASVTTTKAEGDLRSMPAAMRVAEWGMSRAPSYVEDELWMAMPVKCFKTTLINLFSTLELPAPTFLTQQAPGSHGQARPVFRSTLKLPAALSALFVYCLAPEEVPEGMQRAAGGVLVNGVGGTGKDAEKKAAEIVVRTMWKLNVFARSKKDPNYATARSRLQYYETQAQEGEAQAPWRGEGSSASPAAAAGGIVKGAADASTSAFPTSVSWEASLPPSATAPLPPSSTALPSLPSSVAAPASSSSAFFAASQGQHAEPAPPPVVAGRKGTADARNLDLSSLWFYIDPLLALSSLSTSYGEPIHLSSHWEYLPMLWEETCTCTGAVVSLLPVLLPSATLHIDDLKSLVRVLTASTGAEDDAGPDFDMAEPFSTTRKGSAYSDAFTVASFPSTSISSSGSGAGGTSSSSTTSLAKRQKVTNSFAPGHLPPSRKVSGYKATLMLPHALWEVVVMEWSGLMARASMPGEVAQGSAFAGQPRLGLSQHIVGYGSTAESANRDAARKACILLYALSLLPAMPPQRRVYDVQSHTHGPQAISYQIDNEDGSSRLATTPFRVSYVNIDQFLFKIEEALGLWEQALNQLRFEDTSRGGFHPGSSLEPSRAARSIPALSQPRRGYDASIGDTKMEASPSTERSPARMLPLPSAPSRSTPPGWGEKAHPPRRGRQVPDARSLPRRSSRSRSRSHGERPIRMGSSDRSILRFRSEIPIARIQKDILMSVHSNPLTIVSGGRGTGKTTQVPGYLLEDACRRQLNSSTILVISRHATAAQCSAKRLCEEMGKPLGEHIGYVLLGDEVIPQGEPRVVYCTPESALWSRRNSAGAGLWRDVSHVVVDDCDAASPLLELLLLYLRDKAIPDTYMKVVLLSSPGNASTWASYFAPKPYADDGPVSDKLWSSSCPMLEAPAAPTAPVTQLYLEDVCEEIERTEPQLGNYNLPNLSRDDDCTGWAIPPPEGQREGSRHLVLTEISKQKRVLKPRAAHVLTTLENVMSLPFCFIARVVHLAIHRQGGPGRILLILPSAEVIEAFDPYLEAELRSFRLNAPFSILRIPDGALVSHFELALNSPEDQSLTLLIGTPSLDYGITLPGITTVINCCREYINFYDFNTESEVQQLVYSARDALHRRFECIDGSKGNGRCIHLISRARVATLPQSALPEMLRKESELPVLQCCALDIPGAGVWDACERLPSRLTGRGISAGLQALEARLLTTSDAALTALGKAVAQTTLSPSTGALLLLSCVWGVSNEGAEVAAAIATYQEHRHNARAKGNYRLSVSGFDHKDICYSDRAHTSVGSGRGGGGSTPQDRLGFLAAQRALTYKRLQKQLMPMSTQRFPSQAFESQAPAAAMYSPFSPPTAPGSSGFGQLFQDPRLRAERTASHTPTAAKDALLRFMLALSHANDLVKVQTPRGGSRVSLVTLSGDTYLPGPASWASGESSDALRFSWAVASSKYVSRGHSYAGLVTGISTLMALLAFPAVEKVHFKFSANSIMRPGLGAMSPAGSVVFFPQPGDPQTGVDVLLLLRTALRQIIEAALINPEAFHACQPAQQCVGLLSELLQRSYVDELAAASPAA